MKKRTRIITITLLAVFAVVVLSGVLVALQMSAELISSTQKVVTPQMADSRLSVAPEEAVSREVMGVGGSTDTGGILPPFPPTAGQTAADVEQRIIKTGFLRLVVNSVNEASELISVHTQEIGGFIQSSSISEREDGTHVGTMAVRVPVDRFEEAVDHFKTFANVVETEEVTGQDVTEQYTDLEARLRNAEAQEETYLGLLDQASDVEDILAIQRELSNIRSQIEFLTGRLQALENQTAYSTINIQLSEEPRVQAPTKEFRPLSAIQEAAQALVNLAQQGVVALIWIMVVGGGLLLPLALTVWVVYRLVKFLKKRRS